MKSIKTRMFRSLSVLCIAALATLRAAQGADQTATGQYVTPTALPGAVQQFLNPHLAAYPNFVAGEAVRSQLSPDGKTLAIGPKSERQKKWM